MELSESQLVMQIKLRTDLTFTVIYSAWPASNELTKKPIDVLTSSACLREGRFAMVSCEPGKAYCAAGEMKGQRDWPSSSVRVKTLSKCMSNTSPKASQYWYRILELRPRHVLATVKK